MAASLFAVQEWIAAGKRFRMPEGNFTTWPLRAALDTGFHSLVEVLLRAGVDQEEKNRALFQAMRSRRLDFIQLLAEHGAATSSIPSDEVISCRDPAIIR